MKKNIYYLLLLFLFLTSIILQSYINNENKGKKNLNFKKIIKNQIENLKKNNSIVYRKNNINKIINVRKLKKNNWKKEFNIFVESNMKLYILKNVYVKKKVEILNSKIINYKIKKKKESKITSIYIYYNKKKKNIYKVLIQKEENNIIYKSKKKIVIKFINEKNKNLIEKYLINGKQSIIFKKDTNYIVNSKILYKIK